MYSNKKNFAAAILAGGKNLRMNGKDKSFIEVEGIPIIQKTINLLKYVFDEIILVTNTPKMYKLYESDVVIVEDIVKDAGPLGGIYAGLNNTSKRAVFFVACDMPFLHNDLIMRQVNSFNEAKCEALIPRIGSFIEPLHAIYKKNLKDKLCGFLESTYDYSIRKFLENINVYYMDLEDNFECKRVFSNLNTSEDLERMLVCDAGKVKGLA